MRRALALACSILLAAGCAIEPRLASVPADQQVLVVMEDDQPHGMLPAGSRRGYRGDAQWPVSLHTRAASRRLARDHGLEELYAWPIRSLGVFCVVFRVPLDTDRRALVRRLDQDPRVSRAQPVNVFEGMLADRYDDPLFDIQYGENRHLLELLHARTTGQGVRVAIVDSPVDEAHADLEGQIARQVPPFAAADLQELRHGTAVTGVIAAAAGNGEGLVGLAPDASVSVYAGCRHTTDGATRCTTVTLAEAIERAADDTADVINLSIAGPNDWLLARLLRRTHEDGAVLVAADNRQDADRSFPGSLPFVHAAGPDVRAWFARPERFSTRAGGGYQVFFGSSMAAAGVTGVATLLRAEWSAAETEAILERLLEPGCARTANDDSTLRILAAHEHCTP